MRAAIGLFLAGKPRRERHAVIKENLSAAVIFVRIRAVTARIEFGHVDIGITEHHPLRQIFSSPAALRDAKACAATMPKILQANRWPQQWSAVGRMRDRAVDEAPQTNFTKNRHPLNRALQPWGDALQIFGEQLAGRIPFRVSAAWRPCFGQARIFVHANQSAFLLLPEISRHMGATHDRYFFIAIFECGDRIGDNIMMFHVRHRNINARHLRDLPGIAARRIYDDFGPNRALFRLHIPFARWQLRQARHAVFAYNFGAHILGTNGERVANTRWISMSVFGRPRTGDDTVKRHEWVVAENFLRRDNLHLEPDDFRKALNVAHPRQLALVGCKTDAAGFMPTDILPGQTFQPWIEVIAIGMHLGKVEAARDVGALSSRVPCRAGGQLILFDQQTVRPPEFGEMVKQRSPHYAAADYHNSCRCLHKCPAPYTTTLGRVCGQAQMGNMTGPVKKIFGLGSPVPVRRAGLIENIKVGL